MLPSNKSLKYVLRTGPRYRAAPKLSRYIYASLYSEICDS